MRNATYALIAVVAFGTGCITLQQMSSGAVGCPPGEISIADYHAGLGATTWTASCRGETYYCTNISSPTPTATGPAMGPSRLSCHPAIGNNDTARRTADGASAGIGCTYDLQCKGDRICVNGRCTEPNLTSVTYHVNAAAPSQTAVDAGPTAPPANAESR